MNDDVVVTEAGNDDDEEQDLYQELCSHDSTIHNNGRPHLKQ
jgi:hypothetical protein